MTKRVLVPGILAVALLSSALSAQAEEDFSRTGCYLGIAGSVALLTEKEDDLESERHEGVDIDESTGLNLRAGCRGLWIGAELHYEWIDSFDVSGDTFDKTYDVWALTGDFKLFMLQGRYQPFATVGLGYMEVDSDWDYAARLGGGIDIYITEHIALNLDATYVIPVSDEDLDDFDYVSVGWGFIYRF